MEQIIILIVIGLISTLFNKKGKEDVPERKGREADPVKPSRSQTQSDTSSQPDPFKRLKDLTGDIYREVQEEQQKHVDSSKQTQPSVILQTPSAKTEVSKSTLQTQSNARENETSRGRLSTHNPDEADRLKPTTVQVDFTNGQDLLKGVLFSEILGPPKSKQ